MANSSQPWALLIETDNTHLLSNTFEPDYCQSRLSFRCRKFKGFDCDDQIFKHFFEK